MTGPACNRPDCSGHIAQDGYCDTCGAKYVVAAAPAPVSARATIGAPVAPSRRVTSPTGSSGPVSRRTSSRRTAGTRAQLGAGLVEVAPTPVGDPSAAVMSDEQVAAVIGARPEGERFCASCGRPVGRASADRPGRIKGFCGNCRAPFDFTTNMPSLTKGDLVGGQYEIVGCLAHGGLGWIYLARDTAVSNRWVVLKGLLSSGDPDAIAAAVAERQFLARVEHGSIVRIYNFVTWRGAGYIVMEYVGGESLNSKLKQRRRANGGAPDPLPVADAIAYMLATLPALAHLHRLGLLYNDLKPANIMAVADDVKLIDLGAVIRADDPNAIVFGTQGFQAPEVASVGPSVAADIYTVGRTLAVLILNFVFHEGRFLNELPPPAEEPLFEQWESLYRFLLKTTAADPAERFQSADEIVPQLYGVLREIVAVTERRPHAAASVHFSGDQLPNLFAELGDDLDVTAATWRALPALVVDPTDLAAPYLTNQPRIGPIEDIRALDEAVAAGHAPDTVEVRLRKARSMIDGGTDPQPVLALVEADDPWEWRAPWLRAVWALSRSQFAEAADLFSHVWTDQPGELAPKLGLALAAEGAGENARAAQLYDLVCTVDDGYVSAMFGLARVRAAGGDRAGVVQAYSLVPTSSAVYIDAQLAAARSRVAASSSPDDLVVAASTIDRLLLDTDTRLRAHAEILEAALAGLQSASWTVDPSVRLLDVGFDERSLRRALERTYRDLGRAARTAADRTRLVDLANTVRPVTVF
jgi:serine/threonine-protein kinase PknG